MRLAFAFAVLAVCWFPAPCLGLTLGMLQVEERFWLDNSLAGGFFLFFADDPDSSIFYVEGVGYSPVRPWAVGSTLAATPSNSTYLDQFIARLTNGIDEEIGVGYFEGTSFGGQRSHIAVGGGFESSLFAGPGPDLAGFSVSEIQLRIDANASTGSVIRGTVTISGAEVPEPSAALLLAAGLLKLRALGRLGHVYRTAG